MGVQTLAAPGRLAWRRKELGLPVAQTLTEMRRLLDLLDEGKRWPAAG